MLASIVTVNFWCRSLPPGDQIRYQHPCAYIIKTTLSNKIIKSYWSFLLFPTSETVFRRTWILWAWFLMPSSTPVLHMSDIIDWRCIWVVTPWWLVVLPSWGSGSSRWVWRTVLGLLSSVLQ
jgi:hypothetical protein